MKSVMSVLLILFFCFSISACNKDSKKITSEVSPTGIQSQVISPTAIPTEESKDKI